jgi:hypothetical protein
MAPLRRRDRRTRDRPLSGDPYSRPSDRPGRFAVLHLQIVADSLAKFRILFSGSDFSGQTITDDQRRRAAVRLSPSSGLWTSRVIKADGDFVRSDNRGMFGLLHPRHRTGGGFDTCR